MPRAQPSQPRPLRKRIVRSQSLWSRITSWPFDTWLAVNESLNLIEWDSYSVSVALPLGMILSILLLIFRVYYDITQNSGSSQGAHSGQTHLTSGLFDKNRIRSLQLESGSDLGVSTRSRISMFFTALIYTLSLILWVVCVGNSLWVFAASKSYTLLGRASDNAPPTPSAVKTMYSAPPAGETGDGDSFISEDLGERPSSVWYVVVGYLFRLASLVARSVWGFILSFFTSTSRSSKSEPQPKENEDADRNIPSDIWTLHVWDPSMFGLHLTCTFSPLHAVFLWFAPVSVFQIIFTGLLSLALVALVTKFLTLAKDKEILHSEVLGEYSKKMVRPYVAVPLRDVCVSTVVSSVESSRHISALPSTFVDENDRPLVEVYSPVVHGKFQPRDVREVSTQSISTLNSQSDMTFQSPSHIPLWSTPRNRHFGGALRGSHLGYYSPDAISALTPGSSSSTGTLNRSGGNGYPPHVYRDRTYLQSPLWRRN